jgi:hypothetical protein
MVASCVAEGNFLLFPFFFSSYALILPITYTTTPGGEEDFGKRKEEFFLFFLKYLDKVKSIGRLIDWT